MARSTEERIAWFLGNDPAGVGLCAQHTWHSLGGDYGDPPAWGAANANELYDLIVASGRYWTTEPPRGAVVVWKYGANGHAALSYGSGFIATTDPAGLPGRTGVEPLSYPESWGASASRRIWTDTYNGVRFEVAGETGPVPPPPTPADGVPGVVTVSWDGPGSPGVAFLYRSDYGPVIRDGESVAGQPLTFLFEAAEDIPTSSVLFHLYPYAVWQDGGPWASGSAVEVTVPYSEWSTWDPGPEGVGDYVFLSSDPGEPGYTIYEVAAEAYLYPTPPVNFSGDFTGVGDIGTDWGYSTRVVPLPDPTIPGIPPGTEYQIELLDPNGNVIAIGFLPPGADPNTPYTFRVDGRFIIILYGGAVLITYLIPQAVYDAHLSTFWVGYVDANGDQLPDGDGVRGTPPDAGYQWSLDTGFWETVYPTRLSRVKNRVSEAIWENQDGSLQASRLIDPDLWPVASWGLAHGQTSRISYPLAVRVWEAGLSRFLRALPNETERVPLTWGDSMEAWSTGDYDWMGNALTWIYS